MKGESAGSTLVYDADLERLLLAAAMNESSVCKIVLDGAGLLPDHFHLSAHKDIWAAVAELYLEDESTDPVAVARKLAEYDKLNAVGGAHGLMAIYSSFLTEFTMGGAGLGDKLITHCGMLKALAADRYAHVRALEARDLAKSGADPVEVANFLRETADEIDVRLAREDDDDEFTLNDLRRLGQQGYDWVIPDGLERGDVFMITGGSGSGKSLWSLQAALQCNVGVNPFNPAKRMPKLSVLYVQVEDDPREEGRRVERMWQTAEGYGVDHDRFIAIMPKSGLNLSTREGMARFRQLIYRYRPDIVFLCPWKDLHGGLISQGDGGEASFMKVKAQLDTLRKADPRTGRKGFALWIEAHTTGGVDGSTSPEHFKPRGTIAQVNWVTYGMALIPLRDEQTKDPIPGSYHLGQWRGPRDRSRVFPYLMKEGQPWPWMPNTVIAMDTPEPASGLW